MSIAVVGDLLSDFRVGADDEVTEHVHHRVLDVLRVVDQLVGRASKSSDVLSDPCSEGDGVLANWFEPDFIIGDDGDIFAEGLTFNQLLRDNFILHNHVEEPPAASDL